MRVNGLEAWFVLPEVPNALPPPKWKTAIVSAISIYPVISWMPILLNPITTGLPAWLATLVSIAIMMLLMTWGRHASGNAIVQTLALSSDGKALSLSIIELKPKLKE